MDSSHPADEEGALATLAAEAREHRLVIIAGAGISMLPPSSLPSWWAFNEAVLRALAARLAETTSALYAEQRLERMLERREALRSFTPDFMAQLMEEEAGPAYFRVLESLDTEETNENHVLLAALADAGVARAIVTTNFDRLLERALEARSVPHRVFATTAEFEELPAALDATPELLLLKVHGSVERADSLVDTLAQRVAGRPRVLEDAVTRLLESHACLVLGFSGADLAYDENYLGLRAAAAGAIELTVLNRAGSAPLEAMGRLVEAFGPRGRTVDGELPAALRGVLDELGVDAPEAPAAVAPSEPPADRLARRTREWVDGLGTGPALNMFVALVDAGTHDAELLRFLMFFKRYYRTTGDGRDPAYWRFELNFGRRLLDQGLLGQYSATEAGLAYAGTRDVDAEDYTSAIQFLGRAGDRDVGNLLEARIELTRALALQFGPAKVLGNAEQALQEAGDAGPKAIADVGLLGAELLELVGKNADAIQWARMAYAAASELGDDSRRGRVAARAGRALALSGQLETARELAEAALAIGMRLDLPAIEADALASLGLLEVVGTNSAAATESALEPLRRAAGLYRQLRRRPRLLMTLCDLVRAEFYAGTTERFEAALTELDELTPAFPGLEPHARLTKVELLRHAGAHEEARQEAGRLLESARDTQNEWAAEKARRALAPTDATPGEEAQ